MTQIKLAGAMPAGCVPEEIIPEMWRRLGTHYMAVVEMQVVNRTEPAVGETTERTAQLRIVSLELARSATDDETLREALRGRRMSRQMVGTLDAILGNPGRNDSGELKDALAVIYNRVTEEGDIRGFPVKAEWDGDDLVLRLSREPEEPAEDVVDQAEAAAAELDATLVEELTPEPSA